MTLRYYLTCACVVESDEYFPVATSLLPRSQSAVAIAATVAAAPTDRGVEHSTVAGRLVGGPAACPACVCVVCMSPFATCDAPRERAGSICIAASAPESEARHAPILSRIGQSRRSANRERDPARSMGEIRKSRCLGDWLTVARVR